jgi:hypothetical protein
MEQRGELFYRQFDTINSYLERHQDDTLMLGRLQSQDYIPQ